MRFQLIDAKKADLPIERMCALLTVSVGGYYAWKNRRPSQRQLDDLVFLAHIRAHFAASNGTYGSPRMHVDLCEEGLNIDRHRVARLMRDNALKANQKRRFKKTTDAINPILAATGYNFRLILKWIRLLLRQIWIMIFFNQSAKTV